MEHITHNIKHKMQNTEQKCSMLHAPCSISSRASRERGVALLFVILLTSVLLMVTIGISNITFKELTFSLEARDSDKAFFAADTGIECALYLDKLGTFDGTHPTADCAGVTGITIFSGSSTTFNFALPLGGQCAQMTIDTAVPDPDPMGSAVYTTIKAFGYNVNDSGSSTSGLCVSPSVASSRVVSRGLSVSFPNGGTGTGSTGGVGCSVVDSPILDNSTTATVLPGGNIKLTGLLDTTTVTPLPRWPLLDVGFDILDSSGFIGVGHVARVNAVTPVPMPTPASPGFAITFDPTDPVHGFSLVSGVTYTISATAQNGCGSGFSAMPLTSFVAP